MNLTEGLKVINAELAKFQTETKSGHAAHTQAISSTDKVVVQHTGKLAEFGNSILHMKDHADEHDHILRQSKGDLECCVAHTHTHTTTEGQCPGGDLECCVAHAHTHTHTRESVFVCVCVCVSVCVRVCVCLCTCA